MPQAKDEAGNVWETDAQGNPVRLLTQGAAMPANPTFPYQGPKAAAEAQNAGVQADINSATKGSQIEKAGADAVSAQRNASTAGLPEGFMWSPVGGGAIPIPGYTRQGLSPEVRQKALAQWTSAQQLDRTIAELESLYKQGPGSTKGVAGIQDYLPTTANERFNTAANAARGIVRNALGLTGGEANTATEAQMNLGAYIPQAGNYDKTIEDSIQRLRDLAGLARKQSVETLGGVPDENGKIVPLGAGGIPAATLGAIGGSGGSPPPAGGAGGSSPGRPVTPFTINRSFDGTGTQAAPFGATSAAVDLPPQMQAENKAWFDANLGNFDPQKYVEFRTALDKKYGFGSNPDAYLQWANATKAALDKGGATIRTGIPAPERQMSSVEQVRNNAVNNPVGAAIAGAADAGAFGIPTALAPEQMAALQASMPKSTLAGEMIGSVTGTSGLARGAASVTGRIAPSLLKGGELAQFGRNLAADAAYGAIYGDTTRGDPLTGAVLGAVGSGVGQVVGRGTSNIIAGVDLRPAAQLLRDSGVGMTGARILGELPSRIEDKAASLPFVGDMIRARQGDQFRDFNRAAFNAAGDIIGAQPTAIGRLGLDQLGQAREQAYNAATAGVSGPLDGQFAQDMQAVVAKGQNLPPDLRKGLGEVLDARLYPTLNSGTLTGDQYQQAIRALKTTRSNPPARFQGFEQDYRNAVTGAMDALNGQMQRIGGPQVQQGLEKANQFNKALKILENASLDRARVGTRSGQTEVFTPSQLLDASRASEKKYGPTQALIDLGQAGQEVLPSTVPNSGTADRLLMNGLGLAALGGGEVSDKKFGTNISPYVAAATILATAGGTKAGQKALSSVLIDRPALARSFGRYIGARQPLFGHAAVPLALTAGGF